MRWDGFERACPDIAVPARDRFLADGLVLVGTLRRDGSPRISPNEPAFGAGRLFISMMWRSRKALDVLRDPRVAIHSVPSDRENPRGDVKLSGRLVDEQDPGVREAFRAGLRERIGWAPDEPTYHCFSLEVQEAALLRLVRDPIALVWDVERGLRQLAVPTETDH